MNRFRRRNPASGARHALLVLLALLTSSVSTVALAHATLVIGDLEVLPDPPVPGAAATLRISLVDPLMVAVEKALVRVEFREIDPEDPAVPASITGTEATAFLELPAVLTTEYLPEVEDGVYSGSFMAPVAGRYTVSVRDTTFRNEEAIANIGVNVGGASNGVVAFVLPPTPIAPSSIGTWLLWIIGIPLAAGLVITFFALRRPVEAGPEGTEPYAEDSAEDDPRPSM